MPWCEVESIRSRIKPIEGLILKDDEEVSLYISNAENEVRSRIVEAYGADTLLGWDANGAPPRIIQLVEDLSILLILKDKMVDFTGRVGDSKATYGFLSELQDGTSSLTDSNGQIIGRVSSKIRFNQTGKTPLFSMGNEGDGSTGTLDDF